MYMMLGPSRVMVHHLLVLLVTLGQGSAAAGVAGNRSRALLRKNNFLAVFPSDNKPCSAFSPPLSVTWLSLGRS